MRVSLLLLVFVLASLTSHAKTYAPKTDNKTQGVGLSVYLDRQLVKSLFELSVDHHEDLEQIAFFTEEAKTIDPSMMHCQVLAWVPLQSSDKHPHNRIQCEADWGTTPRQFFINLANDELTRGKNIFDPSFSMKGAFSSALTKLIEDNQHSKKFLNQYQIQIIKDFDEKDIFVLGKTDVEEPFLICKPSKQTPTCELRWSKIQTQQASISLGDHGTPLAKAICSGRKNLTVMGLCPSDWNNISNVDCHYVGLWVNHDVWGTVDSDPKLVCRYEELQTTRWFEVPLGPVVTKAWGSRHSVNPSISITGAGLKSLYEVLKTHALTKKTEDKYALSYSQMGAGEWGYESVSLKRYSTPDELLSAFSCEFVDTSYRSSRQVPHKDFIFERERYICTVHNG